MSSVHVLLSPILCQRKPPFYQVMCQYSTEAELIGEKNGPVLEQSKALRQVKKWPKVLFIRFSRPIQNITRQLVRCMK